MFNNGHPFIIQKNSKFISLNDIYANSNNYLFPYARYAFLEALKKLNIKSIYIPAFICRDMLSPINTLNISYYFYNVSEKMKPFIEDIKCDAILAVDYFGFEQDMEPFLEYKKKYNSIIIEDNAHGLFSKDLAGNLLGTRGDIGLLSIRKTVALPNGAVLLINNSNYKKINFEKSAIKKTREDKKYYTKQFVKKFIINKRLGILIVLIKRLIRLLKTGASIPVSSFYSEKELPNNIYLTPLLKNNKLSIDIEFEIKRRRDLYSKMQYWALKFGIKPLFDLYENCVPFEFPFVINEYNFHMFKKFELFLIIKGFYVLPWPSLPSHINSVNNNDFYKNIKVVPFLW
jgi:hypothetical protein